MRWTQSMARWAGRNSDSMAAGCIVILGTSAIVEPVVLLVPAGWVLAIFAKAAWLEQRRKAKATAWRATMREAMVQRKGRFSVKEGNGQNAEFHVVWGKHPGEVVRSFRTEFEEALAEGMSHVQQRNAQTAYDLAEHLNEGGAAREQALGRIGKPQRQEGHR